MTVVPASDALPLSPELVLVSPPAVARLARQELASFRKPAAPAARPRKVGALELTAVYLFCLLVTLGPLLLALLTRQTVASV